MLAPMVGSGHPRSASALLRGRLLVTAVVAACIVASATAPAAAVPGAVPPQAPPPVYDPLLDAPTRRALELEQTIQDLNAEIAGMDTRLSVLASRIADRSGALEKLKAELRAAQDAYNARAVVDYKTGGFEEFAVLLSADSWKDLITRATLVAYILDVDRWVIEELSVVQAQAAFQAGLLADLRSQDAAIKDLRAARAQLADTSLTEQRTILAALTAPSLALVTGRQTAAADLRAAWAASSVTTGTTVAFRSATVAPYKDRMYQTTGYHPVSFRSTGVAYNAVCTWYGPGFGGRALASGALYNPEDLTCASPTLAFGTWLALSRGAKRVVVVVSDRGPYTTGRDLELSRAAADALGLTGVEPVQVEIVTPGE
jgi:rare lipoprotein A (peptidoglycan hydrolase)